MSCSLHNISAKISSTKSLKKAFSKVMNFDLIKMFKSLKLIISEHVKKTDKNNNKTLINIIHV